MLESLPGDAATSVLDASADLKVWVFVGVVVVGVAYYFILSSSSSFSSSFSFLFFENHHFSFFSSGSSSSPCVSEVHSVRLSLSNCIISVLSLYESSLRVSSSAIASSNACLAR